MKFKVSTIAYYGLILLHLLIFALWLALIFICPVQNWEDFSTILAVFLILELLLFTCSPIAHRTVTIDDTFITENGSVLLSTKWKYQKYLILASVPICLAIRCGNLPLFPLKNCLTKRSFNLIKWVFFK